MKVGFIGAALGHPLGMTKALYKYNLASDVGIWAPDSEQGQVEKFSKQVRYTIYSSAEELIDKSDAIIITTQTNQHEQYALIAMKKHKPVFVDKPFVTCYADAAEIIEKALSANTAVMSCSIRRYAPAFDTIASAIRGNQIGRPISAIGFEPHGVKPGDWQDRIETSGGLIYNFGIHCVDPLQKALGPKAVEVSTYAGKLVNKDVNSHDFAVITIYFENGSVGTAQVIGCMSPGDKMATAPSMRVFCTDNTLEARLDENYAYQYAGGRYGVSPYYELNGGMVDTMKAFVEMAQTGRPAIPYDEMLEVAKILEAARKSANENRRVLLSEI